MNIRISSPRCTAARARGRRGAVLPEPEDRDRRAAALARRGAALGRSGDDLDALEHPEPPFGVLVRGRGGLGGSRTAPDAQQEAQLHVRAHEHQAHGPPAGLRLLTDSAQRSQETPMPTS